MDIKDITNALRAVNDCTCEQPCLKIEILCDDAADVIERQAERLAAYRNATNHTPEECAAAFKELSAYRDAEQDGTLVKLPCKVGDTVYLSDGKEAFEMQVGSLFPAGFIVKSRLCNAFLVDKYTYKCVVFSDFNKTVFLTPEAAEAALKEQEANQ